MAGDFGLVSRTLDQFANELGGQAQRKRLATTGKLIAKIVDQSVRSTPARKGSLSDQSMSGWKRGHPIKIGGRVGTATPTQVEITPTAAGPMRVLEQGRNQGAAGAFHGPGIIRKGANAGLTGRTKGGNVRKVRTVGAKRWNGVTEGKGTWSRAAEAATVAAPKEYAASVEMAMARLFKKG